MASVTLSAQQKLVLKQICETGHNTILCGAAGSGKSAVIRALVSKYLPYEVALTAMTAQAAEVLSFGDYVAKTLHSWGGLGDRALIDKVMRSHGANYRRAKILIIDECSMLGAKLYEQFDTFARRIRGQDSPFGGLQVVLVGDYFQICPVKDAYKWTSPMFDYDYFDCFQLNEIHRQSDRQFIEVLRRIREWEVTAEDLHYLQDHCSQDQLDDCNPSDMLTICSTLAEANPINQRCLDALDGEAVPHGPRLRENGGGGGGDGEGELLVKRGMRIVFTKNTRVYGCNGRRAVIVNPNYYDETVRKHGVVVRYDDTKKKGIVHRITVERSNGAKIECMPFEEGYASTIHKMQGQTIDCPVHIDLTRVFEFGQVYVALSRLKHLSLAIITGLSMSAIFMDRDSRRNAIVAHMARLTRSEQEEADRKFHMQQQRIAAAAASAATATGGRFQSAHLKRKSYDFEEEDENEDDDDLDIL